MGEARPRGPAAGSVPKAAVGPRIVHVVGTLGAGGVQRLVLGLAASSAGRAYRHSVLCLFGAKGNLAGRFEEAGLPVGFCPVPWPTSLDVGSYRLSRFLRQSLAWSFPYRFARELRRGGAELVHSHVSHRIDLQAEGAIRCARVPLLWTIHGQYRPEGRELERWRRAARLASEGLGAITVVAEDLANDFRRRGLVHPAGIPVTQGGVDLSVFGPSGTRDPGWRAQRGIPANAIVFGASGRLVVEKAYEVFVRAAGRIVAEGADAHFVIAGGGPLKDMLEGEIARAGLEGRFHLVGFLDEVPRFLRELDVFVLSSRFEGFPIALVEALASGLPCIATAVGGVQEMVGGNGALVVPPESEEALADAMRKMRSAAVRASFAARGPQIAERFSIDRMAEQFSALYARLLSPDGAAGRRLQRKVNER